MRLCGWLFLGATILLGGLLYTGAACAQAAGDSAAALEAYRPGDVIELPQPKRWLRCPRGRHFEPNGVDEVYRIENGFHGQAVTATEDRTPIFTQQFQTTWPRLQRFRFEQAGAGRYRIYFISQQGEKLYLGTTGGKPRRGVIEVEEIGAYGPDGQALITDAAKARMSSQFGAYVARNAIDGRKETFAHTAVEEHPWLEVDLGRQCEIARLEIQVRTWFSWRMRRALVSVLDDARRPVWQTKLVGSRALYRLELPHPVGGRYVRVERDFSRERDQFVYATPGAEGRDKLWLIEKMRPEGFYRIVHAASGLCLEAPRTPGPDIRCESHVPVRLVRFQAGQRTMLWTIEPVRDEPMDCLALSQIGWAPKAPKFAMLVRRKKLDGEPAFAVTEPAEAGRRRVVLAGRAKYRGELFTLHYYFIDLTALRREGDYWLDCDGDRAVVHIADDAYVRCRHRCGTDVTYLRDILDSQWGYVGHWAHLENWCPGAEAFDEPFWLVRDYRTGETKFLEPRRRIEDKYVGGWDHTDRQWGALQPSASLMQHLALCWRLCRDAELKRALVREMIYGARYFLNTQNPDGSWPVHTNIANKLTGTVAAVAGALAAAAPAVRMQDAKLARRMVEAAVKGWHWVRANPGKWVPIPVSYRHGRAEEEMLAALHLGRVAGLKQCLQRAHEMILAAKINPKNGAWVKREGSFAGQAVDDRGTIRALMTLMDYFPEAPADVQAAIRQQVADYYAYLMRLHRQFGGPFGTFERGIGGYGPNSKWVRRGCFFYRAYIFGGRQFADGYFVAERIMDWMVGANPYGTSCVFGFGDLFLIPGWLRAYEIGSLLPGLAVLHQRGKGAVRPLRLTATRQGYGNMESEAEAGVVFLEAMVLRHRLRNSPPQRGGG